MKGFTVINEAEVGFFFNSCVFYDPANVGNVISGSFAFSKSILYVWKFSVHLLLNQELPDVQTVYRKGRGTRDEIGNIHWILENAREFWKTSTSASLTMLKPLTMDHNKLW